MDWFAFHPYGSNSSELPSDAARDRDEHHARRLRQAREGARPGLRRDEADRLEDPDRLRRVRNRVHYPEEAKRRKYTGAEPASTKPVSPTVQGERYKQALGLAFCQPTVKAMFLYHAFDEVGRGQWQSGLYYVDHTAKRACRSSGRPSRKSSAA